MQPMMENWAGSKGEWLGGISWKTIEYHGMLFSPVYVRNLS